MQFRSKEGLMYKGYERPIRASVQRDFMGLNSSLPSPSSPSHEEWNLSLQIKEELGNY